jgi:hypothetical protein
VLNTIDFHLHVCISAQGGASKSHVSSGTNASSHSQRVKATGNESKIRKGNQGDEDDADSCPEEPAPVPVPPRSSRSDYNLVILLGLSEKQFAIYHVLLIIY